MASGVWCLGSQYSSAFYGHGTIRARVPYHSRKNLRFQIEQIIAAEIVPYLISKMFVVWY